MPDEITGIPLHPLVVHATVVLVPLAAIATILITVVPRWRRTYGWLVVAASAAALITVPLAVQSGKRLLETREFGGPVLEKVLDHQAMGERVIWAVAPLFILNLAMMLMIRARRSSGQVTVVAVVASLAAVAAIVLVVLTGHLGSMAVWNPTG
jgi:uncharacterized membrane protein